MNSTRKHQSNTILLNRFTSNSKTKPKLLIIIYRQQRDCEVLPVVDNTKKTSEKSSRSEHICHICGKSFPKSKSLEKHKTIEATFQCTVCGSYESQLSFHRQTKYSKILAN